MDFNALMQFFQQQQQAQGRGVMPGQGQTTTDENGQEWTAQANGQRLPGGPMRAFNAQPGSADFMASHPAPRWSGPPAQMNAGVMQNQAQPTPFNPSDFQAAAPSTPNPNQAAQMTADAATRAPVPVPQQAAEAYRAPMPVPMPAGRAPIPVPQQGGMVPSGPGNAQSMQASTGAAFSPMSSFAPTQRMAAPSIASSMYAAKPVAVNNNIKNAQAAQAYAQAHPATPAAGSGGGAGHFGAQSAAPPPPPPPPVAAAAPPPPPPPPAPAAGGLVSKALQMASANQKTSGNVASAAQAATGQSNMSKFVGGMPGAAALGARRF